MIALNRSICDIDLLIHASQAAYRIKSKNVIQDDIDAVPDYDRVRFLHTHKTIQTKQYDIYATISPDEFEGKSHVCALALKPHDDASPVVIAFRGTMTKKDMGSNLNIVFRGVAGKNLCHEARQFYEKIKLEFPDREIVLTGHSLGGHLAQYVAAKAYANQDENIIVRTFNSAPIGSKHASHISGNFVHYRFFDDWVAGVSFSACYGDLYTFRIKDSEKIQHGFNILRKLYEA